MNTLHRYVVYLTYALAIVLVLVINPSLWVTLVIPVWFFLIGLYILILNRRMKPDIREND